MERPTDADLAAEVAPLERRSLWIAAHHLNPVPPASQPVELPPPITYLQPVPLEVWARDILWHDRLVRSAWF